HALTPRGERRGWELNRSVQRGSSLGGPARRCTWLTRSISRMVATQPTWCVGATDRLRAPMLLWRPAALIRSRLWVFRVPQETPGVDLITGRPVRALDRVVHRLEVDVTVL